MCATSSAKPLPKIHCRDLLITAFSIVEGDARSGEQLDLTTAFEQFQITNVYSTDGYGLRTACECGSVGAIVEGPGGNVFIKFTGPAKTIAASQAEFEQLLNSFDKEK